MIGEIDESIIILKKIELKKCIATHCDIKIRILY